LGAAQVFITLEDWMVVRERLARLETKMNILTFIAGASATAFIGTLLAAAFGVHIVL
jgi:hypothetical protein